MKKLILFLFFICIFGFFKQEVSVASNKHGRRQSHVDLSGLSVDAKNAYDRIKGLITSHNMHNVLSTTLSQTQEVLRQIVPLLCKNKEFKRLIKKNDRIKSFL